MSTAFQDTYPDDVAHCYGCGTQNPAGHQLKSHWDGEETVARFTPRPEHTAMPGYVYGGLIASLVDCHGTGSAAAAGHRAQRREMGTEPALRYVTASLHVDYLAPTPMGVELELRGVIEEVTERKVVVAETVHAGETLVAKGKVVAVLMPAGMVQG
ncbi:PaaI family thioesterase [Janibacter indicus]|uniref:PaaI family thioesterase n=1 Tax=Janibacter indicus TaxID=857417 RepID=UPI003EC00665